MLFLYSRGIRGTAEKILWNIAVLSEKTETWTVISDEKFFDEDSLHKSNEQLEQELITALASAFKSAVDYNAYQTQLNSAQREMVKTAIIAALYEESKRTNTTVQKSTCDGVSYGRRMFGIPHSVYLKTKPGIQYSDYLEGYVNGFGESKYIGGIDTVCFPSTLFHDRSKLKEIIRKNIPESCRHIIRSDMKLNDGSTISVQLSSTGDSKSVAPATAAVSAANCTLFKAGLNRKDFFDWDTYFKDVCRDHHDECCCEYTKIKEAYLRLVDYASSIKDIPTKNQVLQIMHEVLSVKVSSKQDAELLVDVLDSTRKVLADTNAENKIHYQNLIQKAHGHPQPEMKGLARAMFVLGVCLLIASIPAMLCPFPVGLLVALGAVLAFAAYCKADDATEHRSVSKEMNKLSLMKR